MRMLPPHLLPAVLLGITASPAFAEEAKGPISVSGGANLVSDYRFRGISQSDRRFAVQGTLSVAHEFGFYATIWSSSIDDYVANGSDQEIDLFAGYKRSFGATTVDAGVLYYYYPGSGGITSDFVEPYASVTQAFGQLSAKASVAWAPKQTALSVGFGREHNLYLAGDLSYAIPNLPISLNAHLGRSEGPSYLTVGKGHTDWSLGATATWKGLTAGISYVDTDTSFITPSGRNASGAGIVASLGASF